MSPARLAAGLFLLPVLGCSVAPPPPEPDPIQSALRREGRLVQPDPAQLATCVSQGIPLSFVQLRRDAAVVRPAPGTAMPGRSPDYALVLEQRGREPVAWRILVAETGPAAEAAAQALDRALEACIGLLGKTS